MTSADYLRRAVELARKGEGHTRPNPPVGAVIVKNGVILGEGFHHRCGKAHAEVEAIANARRRGSDIRGAVIFVTLEPCSKPGRVGACCDAIAAAGLAKVVYAVADPNPKNRGRAKRVLAKRGIACEKFAIPEAEELIRPFEKHVTTGIPYVTVKIAMSLDGKICDDYGDARWVSSVKARKFTGALRERVDAIMVGAETVRKDNPSLLSHGKRNDDLMRVVVSASGKLPRKARVFTDGAVNPTLVYRDVREALADLGAKGVMHVLCEGGMKLAVSLAEEGLVDEWLAVIAPKTIGARHIAKAAKVPRIKVVADN